MSEEADGRRRSLEMSGSTGDLERGVSSSLPLLHQPVAGSSRLATSTADDDTFTETALSLPHPPPKAKGSSGWRWGGGGTREGEGGPWKSSIIPFSLPKRKRLKGPLRAARLCLLSILLPALLLTLPLYVRYRIYGRGEAFPLAASDMRLIDSHISTTWCQRQLVEANASFNAFLMPDTPQVEEEPQKVTMHRSLYLDDDMKEYWGFYLLKGSSVSISACTRWPGASLIVIKGHRHLRECAYIGQKSSEESDEMMLVNAESEMNLTEAGNEDKSLRSKGRSRQVILKEKLTWKSPRADIKRVHLPPPVPRSLERNVEPPTKAGPIETSSEIYDDILKRIMEMGDKGQRVLEKLKNKLLVEDKEENLRNDNVKDSKQQTGKKDTNESAEASLLRKIIEQVVKESWERNKVVQKRSDEAIIKSNSEATEQTIKFQKEGLSNNESVTEKRPDTLALVIQLADRNVTEVLVEADGLKEKVLGMTDENIVDKEAEELLQRARRAILQESLDLAEDEEDKVLNEEQESLEEGHIPKPDGIADDRGTFDDWDPNDRSRSEFWSSFSSSEEALLVCDGLVLYMPLTPHQSCNENEGLEKPYNKISDQTKKTDGRHGPTETTTAHDGDRENTLSYQVPTNGYYFFVFNSENEVQTNFLHIHFDLRRRVYKVKDSIAMCHNATHCELPLSFLSDQKVVLELPLKQGDTNYSDPLLINGQLAERKNQTFHPDANSKQAAHQGSLFKETPDPTGNEKSSKKQHRVEGGEELLWDESYVVVTTCEPRTTLYLCFIISVPLLILLFAFQ